MKKNKVTIDFKNTLPERILEALKEEPMSTRELADILDIAQSRISRAVSSLVERGEMTIVGQKKNSTGRLAFAYGRGSKVEEYNSRGITGKILEVLKDNQLSARQIAETLGFESTNFISGTLSRLYNMGEIDRIEVNGRQFIYFLSTKKYNKKSTAPLPKKKIDYELKKHFMVFEPWEDMNNWIGVRW